MGEFATLYIKGYEVDSWKNSIGWADILFSESDFIETPRPYRGNDEDYYYADDSEGDDEEEPSPGYQYRSTAKNIKDRLEIMGFSIAEARNRFESGVAEALERAKNYSSNSPLKPEEIDNFPIFLEFHPKAVKFYEGYTFDLWCQLIKEIFDKKLKWVSSDDKAAIKSLDPYLHYILERRFDSDILGFPGFENIYMRISS